MTDSLPRFKLLYSAVLVIAVSALACNDPKSDEKNAEENLAMSSPSQTDTSFEFFWAIFRKAVVNNDPITLKRHIHFPIETRGPQDEDKIVKYDQSQFNVVFQSFLKESTDSALTELDLIKKLDKFENADQQYFIINDEWARIGEMEFSKINREWKLTFLYLHYETIEEINKKHQNND
ncbi:MAG: hypothetical protein IPP51_10410 [Bacteroidetes bacterium]|nr:hypothetical protein [Bacteroidota bacterium]